MADAAKAKRREQLKRWAGSSTDREPIVPRRRRRGGSGEAGDPQAAGPGAPVDGPAGKESGKAAAGERETPGETRRAGNGAKKRTVRFERGAEFVAACASGDVEEAEDMLREETSRIKGTGGDGGGSRQGALVNSANADGITALHQACIDDSMDMVAFLLARGADANQADNEGWTPLHVAASCGHLEIADYLLQHGASLSAVNCDGDVPLDIAEDEATETLLREHTQRQGIDLEAVKRQEEEQMLRDAQHWLTEGLPTDLRHPKTGATPLHVAAAKGYLEVMRVLLQCGLRVSAVDNDGWTPLHAASHWGQREACRLLAERLCDMEARSNSGQTPFDVADESVETLLEELSQKQADWRTQHQQEVSEKLQNSAESGAEVPNTAARQEQEVVSVPDEQPGQDECPGPVQGEGGSGGPGAEGGGEREQPSVQSGKRECSFHSQSHRLPQSQQGRGAAGQGGQGAREPDGVGAAHPPAQGDAPGEPRERRQGDRRKFQAPVRDEESESQRKARSRLMRQSRRSTQGVTLIDLKEAEKTVSKATQEPQRSVQSVSPVITVTTAERDVDPSEGSPQDEEGQREKAARLVAKDRRKARRERRSTGIITRTLAENDDSDGLEDSLSDGSTAPSESAVTNDHNRPSSPDYKMLYKTVLEENERLKEKLQEAELLLIQNKVELERQRQSHERNAGRPALLELERFERRALEKRALELEDELKVLSDLRADNQRLKDENAALIRVISRLSK
ncbi:protein phosphatase 1 regulatory subunit 12C [Lepisosteus oculatus]|uniref:protein phosphatase 1 regulatory subunit 12C n=1 Tax=Lepisosteus oculatus TaxID=7918 RepID=UPI0037133F92